MYKNILSVLIFCMLAFHAIGQISMAENMAATIMNQYQDSIVVKKYINHLMQDGQATSYSEADVAKANQRPANWNYEIGVVLTGFENLWRRTGKPEYLQYMKRIVDHFLDKNGNIHTYNMDEFNIDNIPPGRQLITLFHVYKDEKYLNAAQKLKYQLDWQPRTKQGGYWHKLKYPYQMWLDGLYMGQPFRTDFLILTGENSEWDDVANQFIWMAAGARDEKTGLMYHAFDESRVQRWSNPQTGKSPEFWSRAMGWYLIGLADVLEKFPKNHPKRAELIKIFEDLSRALVKFQDPVSKTWWQVTDKSGQKDNYLESSGSSMFVGAMLKGIRLGLLPEDLKPAALAGYEGILKEFVTKDEKGGFHLNRAVSGAGLGGSPYRDGSYDYYVKEPKRDDDLKAIGPFMQAAIEYEFATQNAVGKGKKVVLDRFFNNEYRNGKRFHYTWDDQNDSGFSWLGEVFNQHGATTDHLDVAPTAQNLSGANVYIIVDPDHKKDSPNPNPITQNDCKIIEKWVKNGGTLLLLTNDTTNADVVNANRLAQEFGISFTMKNINFVKNDHFPDGMVFADEGNDIFTAGSKLYVKELVTLDVKPGVKKVVSKGTDIIMVSTQHGKGKVFVIGDPWIYNEYVNGRKLPADFDNYRAMVELVKWALK